MFINKKVKYQKNANPVLTELPCDGGDNDEGDDDEVDVNIKNFGFHNVNAGDGKNKVDLGDVCDGGCDSNDDVGFGNVDGINTNGGDDADFGNDDSKFGCDDDRGSGDGVDKDHGGVDDGDVDSNIGNDTNCGDGRSKAYCSKDAVVDDGNSKSSGGGDTIDDGKGGNDSDSESNECADGHKNDCDDDDECLNFVKNCFKNKQIALENFSLKFFIAVCGSSLFCMYYSTKEELPAAVLVLMDSSLLFLVIEGIYC